MSMASPPTATMGPMEIAGPIAAPIHLGEEGAPQHRGIGDGGAGERREDRAPRDRDQGEPPRHAGDEPVHRVDRLARDPRMEHDLAHQDEEGDGEEGEALGGVDRVPHELLEADGAAHEGEGAGDVDREEGEHHREPQHHQRGEAADEEGEDRVPLHPPRPRRRRYRGRRRAGLRAAVPRAGAAFSRAAPLTAPRACRSDERRRRRPPRPGTRSGFVRGSQSASAERPGPGPGTPAAGPAAGGRTTRCTNIAASRRKTGGAAENSHHSGNTKVS